MIKYLWKQDKLLFAASATLTMGVSAVLLYIPIMVGEIVDALTQQKEVDITLLLVRFMATLVVGVCVILTRNIAYNNHTARRRKRLETDLSARLISKLRSQSEVTNLFNQEIELVNSQYLSTLLNILQTASSFALAIFIAVGISWEILLWVLIFSVVMLLLNQIFSKKLAARTKEAQDSNVEMNKMVTGIFGAIRTINIFSAKMTALFKLDRVFESKKKAYLRRALLDSYIGQMNNFLGWILQYGLIIGSYILVYLGKVSIGQAASLIFMMEYFTGPVFSFIDYKNAIVSTKEIRKKLTNILREPVENVMAQLPPQDIAFRDVSFRYSDEEFMSGINLTLEHGKRYLIVGQSGSGKSTLLKLILKELTPKSGEIMYGGADIAGFNFATWYQNIVYTSQRVEILPGTLRENIILDSVCDTTRFDAIIRMLNLDYLSSKFDVPLSEDLSNFSGGELQRVAIARMLYHDSPIFIFDEFSSALDNLNARQVETELLKIKGKLLISVTHRVHPDLLDSYEKVIIMENGKLKRVGRPSELYGDLQPFVQGNDA